MTETRTSATGEGRRRCALAAVALPLLLGGCFKTYTSAPLDLEAGPAAYAQRTLADPALRDFLARNGVPTEPWPLGRWGLRSLVLVGVALSPEIDVARAQVAVARAGEMTAAARLNPATQTRVERHSERFPRDTPWSFGVLLDIPIVTAGKREARIEQAEAVTRSVAFDIAATAWRVAAKVRQSYFAYAAALRDAALADAEAALRAEEAALIERREALGQASATERDSARFLRAESAGRQARERTRVEGARVALADAVGVPPDVLAAADIALPSESARASAVDAQTAQAAALLNRLDLQRALAQYAVAESALKLEVARQYPDVVLRTGYAWDQGDVVWILGLNMLLALVNRNEGPIAEAEAHRQLEAERFRALQIRVIGEARSAQARHAHALAAERDALAIDREAGARVQRVERRFERGNADRLELTRARLDALNAARLRAVAAMQADLAAGVLEDVLQTPLAVAVNPARALEPLARQERP